MDEQKFIKIVADALKPIQDQLNDPNTGLTAINNRLEILSGEVHDIQDQLKGIKDRIGLGHTRNKREIDEIKTHLGLPIIPDTPEL